MKEYLLAVEDKNEELHIKAQKWAFEHGFSWCSRLSKADLSIIDNYKELWYYCDPIDNSLTYCSKNYLLEQFPEVEIIYFKKSKLMETE